MPRLLLCLLLAAPLGAEPVTFASLLAEMTDRAAIARYPEPAYLCRQFSSYDRAAKSPTEDWFANGDRGQYLREERHGERTEWVMVDTPGPGAVVRIWSANPSGNLYFYLDGATEPTWTVDFQKLTNGEGPVAQPLSAVRSRGWNCYLPIPYARHCKITSDKNDFYYQVNYRTYEAGAEVVSFAPEQLGTEAALLGQVQGALSSEGIPVNVHRTQLHELALAAHGGGIVSLDGPGKIGALMISLRADDLTAALRGVVLQISFDGEETVWAPVGDFFGSGIGANAYKTWWNQVQADGAMVCLWPMPFRRSAEILLNNTTDQPMAAQVMTATEPWTWDDRSMYFHATWRQEWPIDSREKRDWNYVELTGEGVYVGDSLAVMNPTTAWWGEGDEKVYIDGETFPSHFGTGTEDYYGYAWCCPDLFQSPFHAQPRCDGPANFGHTAINRVRLLDGIPFARSLRFDMEIWHWQTVQQANAVTCWFYGKPGLKHNRPPQYEEVVRGVPPLPERFKRPGAIEGETIEILATSPGVETERQETTGYGTGQWSGELHLWGRAREAGAWIDLKVPAPADGRYRVIAYGTKSWDYGIVNFAVNGRDTGVSVDCHSAEVRPTGPIDLGVHEVTGGALTLRLTLTGTNPASRPPHYYFGFDCVVLEPAG